MRIERIGDATLYCGNCFDVIPDLAGIDATITDPPYGISHSTSHGATWANTTIAGDTSTAARDTALRGLDVVASFGTWKTPPIEGARGCLVWDKGPAFGMGDLDFPWKPSHELIYLRGTGWAGRRDPGVLRGGVVPSWESAGRVHPHEKPVWLLATLIRKLPSAQTIFDPFVGSGTTGVACAQLGRKFVGIEIEPRYFDIACERIERAYSQGRLFAEFDAPAEQQGLEL